MRARSWRRISADICGRVDGLCGGLCVGVVGGVYEGGDEVMGTREKGDVGGSEVIEEMV